MNIHKVGHIFFGNGDISQWYHKENLKFFGHHIMLALQFIDTIKANSVYSRFLSLDYKKNRFHMGHGNSGILCK